MINVKKYEGKTEEEAIKKAVEQEKIERDDFIYKIEHIEGKLFKAEKYIVSIIIKEDIIDCINNFFIELGNKMNIDIEVETTLEDDNFNVKLVSNNNSILIGKDGKNLKILQYLIRQVVKVQAGLNAKINLDISNYRYEKLKRLDKEIKHIVDDVVESKMDIYLSPMNAYERRYVHNLVNNFEHVRTESVGEGKERRIIIRYVAE